MSTGTTPVAIWTGTLTLLGVTLRTAVLEHGQRIIHAEDMERLFVAMRDTEATFTPEEISAYAAFRRGDHPV
jgi:hypothetical protein